MAISTENLGPSQPFGNRPNTCGTDPNTIIASGKHNEHFFLGGLFNWSSKYASQGKANQPKLA